MAAVIAAVKGLFSSSPRGTPCLTWTPWHELGAECKDDDVLVVDSVHPGLPRHVGHHKGKPCAQRGALDGDTSTDLVISAFQKKAAPLFENGRLACRRVTCSHFDIDAACAVYACCVGGVLTADEVAVLRCAARVGDFREADAAALIRAPADVPETGLTAADHEVLGAQLCLKLNEDERQLFRLPFERVDEGEPDEEEDTAISRAMEHDKWGGLFGHAVPSSEAGVAGSPGGALFSQVLECLCDSEAVPSTEHDMASEGFTDLVEQCRTVLDASVTSVTRHASIGLVVITTPKPLHYYALFSATRGYDAVLTMYDHGMCELEVKYTTFVDIDSRPTFPRLDLRPLAKLLDTLELSDGAEWHVEDYHDSVSSEERKMDKNRTRSPATLILQHSFSQSIPNFIRGLQQVSSSLILEAERFPSARFQSAYTHSFSPPLSLLSRARSCGANRAAATTFSPRPCGTRTPRSGTFCLRASRRAPCRPSWWPFFPTASAPRPRASGGRGTTSARTTAIPTTGRGARWYWRSSASRS